jgi:allantoinase
VLPLDRRHGLRYGVRLLGVRAHLRCAQRRVGAASMYSFRVASPRQVEDQERFDDRHWVDYSPITARSFVRWPNQARVAVWLCPNVLFYDYLPPPNAWVDTWPRCPHPDVFTYSWQDYGNRVGFWRVLEVLDHFNVPVTPTISVAVFRHLPEIGEAMIARGWDYMVHSIYNSRYFYGCGEQEEREYYREIIETVAQFTGQRVRGIMGPGPISGSERTPDLLAEMGFLYQGDWSHDDQPFPVKVKSGRLVSMPYARDLNSSTFIKHAGWEADDWENAIRGEFDRLYAEADAGGGRLLCIAIHPYLLGQPHRIRYLDRTLAYVLGHDGVWVATVTDIAQYYLDNYYERVVST